MRGRKNGPGAFELGQYVNDRPYAASSVLAVVLWDASAPRLPLVAATSAPSSPPRPFRSKARNLPLLALGNGAELIERLVAPLGWAVETTMLLLDPAFPKWGDSRHFSVRLAGRLGGR